MQPLSRLPVWTEPFERLVMRWLIDRREDASQEEAQRRAERAKMRTEAVRRFIQIEPASRKIESKRHWETRWEPQKEEERIIEALNRLGFSVLLKAGMPRTSEAILSVNEASAANQIVLFEGNLDALAEEYREAGLEIPFSPRDARLLRLAEELFFAARDRIGTHPPKWVDELARPLFVQELFGWGFNPLALQFAEKKASGPRGGRTKKIRPRIRPKE